MISQKREDVQAKETIYTYELSTGLHLMVVPRPGYHKVYATYATHYGSIDNEFLVPATGKRVKVPDGIAHFLEHKMFAQPDGSDAFDAFAQLGASSNAYTDYTSTTFLFSATEHWAKALEILLDFVQTPYFTEENVAKEQGIIEQEIRMYWDMPGDRAHSNLMAALYHHHPLRLDIAGTVDSIQKITPQTLYQCYETFYHPSNMAVVVIGDVDPENVARLVESRQLARGLTSQSAIERFFPAEPKTVRQAYVQKIMPVSAPLMLMGYKDDARDLSGAALVRQEAAMNMLWALSVGTSSDLYDELYQAGLINRHFSAHYTAGETFGVSVLGGETPDPAQLAEVLSRRLPHAPLGEAALERIKRREMGNFVGLFQNPDDLAYTLNQWAFRGADLFAYPALIESITLEDLRQ
ncbi:MAG: pitrilysin family protein, partial [Firmicutes bacterium]|nr:pitrilysin family protein [Bacillota bacterium]